jgi:hypothetical protein
VHPIWLSDLLRAENDQVAGLLKQPDKQKATRCAETTKLLWDRNRVNVPRFNRCYCREPLD